MFTYKMTLTYDGSSYGGWQIQPNALSIQSLVQQAISTLLKKTTSVIGSGRTDAGVHALGQVAHFIAEKEINLYQFQHALNGILPRDVRILDIKQAPHHFHAQHSATGKTYHYHLHLDPVLNPFTRLYSWQVPHPIDLILLQDLIPYFIGTKDFSAFANETDRGAAAKNAVRSLRRLSLIKETGGVRLEFEGDGFLYKMVRNITGTLIDVCAGFISPCDIEGIFLSKDRKKAGRCAPAHGLFLVQVFYEDKPKTSLKEG